LLKPKPKFAVIKKKTMKNIKFIILTLILITSILGFSQEREIKKINISGKIVSKIANQSLGYATISFVNTKNQKILFGGITNEKGEFSVEINAGIYDVKAEFDSFKPLELKQQKLFQDTNLGDLQLLEDKTQLQDVTVQAKQSTVEIKLDKKVYNVGQDMTVKGGNASDVLNNVPSVSVDSDGNVSLRGNDNVRILIDGKPSNAINVATALQSIPADALDKIEVITNPSARYDAEGSAGILNIVLKKGKNNGINGSFTAIVGNPKNYGLNGNINFKTKELNTFATIGYSDSKFQGTTLVNTDYLNTDGTIKNSINERSVRERAKKGYNYNFGFDWNLTKDFTLSNSFTYRRNDGLSPENVLLYNYLPNDSFVRNRLNDQFVEETDLDYTTSFVQKFKKEGHKLSANATFSQGSDNGLSTITDFVIGQSSNATITTSKNFQSQSRNLYQIDYVLPFNKESQFETGYRSDNSKLLTDFNVLDLISGNFVSNPNFTNKLDYKERINAIYAQVGSKINKLSYLFGLRFENSNIDINLLTTNEFNNKNYNNLFPSAFLTYSLSDNTNISLNYSRRITRPRNRFINPFSGFSSNVNIFKGNPDINPAFADAVDFGLLTKIRKVTLTTSLYFNHTQNVFQFVRRPNGDSVTTVVNGQTIVTPITLSTPINLSFEDRLGFEFTLNFSPYKWWKINGNFNFFQSKLVGNNTYVLAGSNQTVIENLDRNSASWFTRINSRITLPYKIDFQANANYTAPQNTSQGQSLGVLFMNLAVSKDVLKDKGTFSLNVNDLFNSQKMIRQANLANLNSYVEMLRRERQINLSFTYRFNKKKVERERTRPENDGSGEF
jgi:outer membrane receptor for ferrienterochelin and colicins